MSSNGYPFTSRRQILERIAAEPPFAHECVSIIEERKGWMASHRARASKLVARMAAGAPTAADYAEALELAARYGKTLARVFRERKLAARPELGTQAAVFGVVGPPTQAATPTETVASSPEPVSEDTADVPIAPEKRGRPKGSKNKVLARSSTEPKRRKRS